MMLQNFYQRTRETLKAAGIDSADLEVRLFIKDVLGITDTDILAGPERPVSEKESQKIELMVQRRLKGEPVFRILGEREFWGLPFKVTPDTLDPRPDTETLVEAALKRFKTMPPKMILDLGTGTGCILISLLHEWPESQGFAVDISEKALLVAQENAERHGVADRIRFIQGDWQGDWSAALNDSFDLIVSNPPYIPSGDIPNLESEVKNHDPIQALDGGKDGFQAYEKIISQLSSLLKRGGAVFLEVGFNQGENVARLAADSCLSVEGVHPDLAGIPRVVEISLGEN